MAGLFKARKGFEEGDVEFWHNPERAGWLMKQGEYIKTWRRRWFVLKQGKIFWFKSDVVTPDSVPRGVIEVRKCLSIKGAEDAINKPHAFEISTTDCNMFFIADSDKVDVLCKWPCWEPSCPACLCLPPPLMCVLMLHSALSISFVPYIVSK
eukprot:GHRR01022816.1.p2 GENE.GHRR01022816.1~~GHRR01022816.1.p2  ORF type:complete len:152 (+),score=14.48 GHRR01022816.1:206-661(+)